ncbi:MULTISPECIES: phage tail domain-containing protein [unclassified Bacillus (in: firmicutes)]|uniref:phage tail domain-containing protein n=1 Tax=unclassified Bacillus (in: firmicutes) TaxID=185979 RepID=UPI0023DA26A4|nr:MULTISPECIES: phage tail domain-containing protein [unclassified Bacillus (in: firmicutes)]MCU4759396.1 phage tail family protein [Bacillus cereus]MDF2016493.1 phage tail family protein [Bacillus sp. Cr_R3]MDF2033747.1 phage tail family protein [Bacillus sp. Cr_R16]
MDVQITRINGQTMKLSDINVQAQDFRVGSIEMRPTYIDVEGANGRISTGSTYEVRTITVPFYFKAQDLLDVAITRDKLFEMILSTEPFYIRELRRLEYQNGDNLIVSGKRYKVNISSTFDINQQLKYGFGELEFETADLPFAESIGKSSDIQRDGISPGSGLWGAGMGIISDPASRIYKHKAVSGQRFQIFNPGNIPVHPFEQELKITISDVAGSTAGFMLKNHTNLSTATITSALYITDTIIYSGPNIGRNGLSFLRNTKKDFIELVPGWNTLKVFNCTSATIEFDFRFYYK